MGSMSAGEVREVPTDQAAHDEKLRRVGVNVARVAHELMSPVSLIEGSLQNLEEHFDLLVRAMSELRREAAQPELRQVLADERLEYVLRNTANLLSICNEGAERVTYVVEQLRGFARRREANEPEIVDVRALLERAERMARLASDRPPAVEWRLGELPPLSGQAQSLGQAFGNVIRNAFDAVAERKDGRVKIAADVTRRDDGRDEIEVRVADNGPGVPAVLRSTIFEPFVSAKSLGRGLGLGLAIAQEAVAAAGGTLELATSEGTGAEFVFRLPVASVARVSAS